MPHDSAYSAHPNYPSAEPTDPVARAAYLEKMTADTYNENAHREAKLALEVLVAAVNPTSIPRSLYRQASQGNVEVELLGPQPEKTKFDTVVKVAQALKQQGFVDGDINAGLQTPLSGQSVQLASNVTVRTSVENGYNDMIISLVPATKDAAGYDAMKGRIREAAVQVKASRSAG